MAGFIENAFLQLYDLGFFSVILPFVLIYVISYGMMMRVKLFKRENSDDYAKYNSILAFCFAFFTVSAVDLTENLPEFVGLISFLFIGLLVLNILLGMVGGNKFLQEGKGRIFYIWFVSLYLLYAVIKIFFDWKDVFKILNTRGLNAIIPIAIFLAIFLGLVFWITKEEKVSSSNKTKDEKEKSSKKDLKKLFDLDNSKVKSASGKIDPLKMDSSKDYSFRGPDEF